MKAFEGGCRTVDNAKPVSGKAQSPEDTPIGRCLAQEQLLRKEVSHYENFVTGFYRKYPEDRDLPLRILIEASEEKTPEQIHEWVSKIGR
jgi:hypothetical protein